MNSSVKAVRPSARAAIIDAAILVLAGNPGATTSEIALTAGVGRATLHRHFRTREDLIQAIQTQSIEETNAAVLATDDVSLPAHERLLRLFKAVIPLGDRFHFLRHQPSASEQVTEQYERELRWTNNLVKQLKEEHVISGDVPVRWAVAQIDQLIWTAWKEVAEGRLAMADAPELAVRTLTEGLGTRRSS